MESQNTSNTFYCLQEDRWENQTEDIDARGKVLTNEIQFRGQVQ